MATVNVAIGSNPNLQQLGPYNDGDAGTEVIRVQRTIVIPFAYVNAFLLANEITPRFFWESIYPESITNGLYFWLVNLMKISMKKSSSIQR